MVLEQRQIDLLISYRDKAYVYAVLCEKSFELFSLVRSLCNIPLILITSVLSIINASDFDPKDMKLPNVIINACVALINKCFVNFRKHKYEKEYLETWVTNCLFIIFTKICEYVSISLFGDLLILIISKKVMMPIIHAM